MYAWDDKEAECHRLYVQEKKSWKELLEYWELRDFTPSKRAFQIQFKRWGFPSQQSPAYKNAELTARVQELWEQNATQKDMLETLQAEGFDINDRELTRLRTRFKWFLRESRSKEESRRTGDKPKRKRNNDPIDQPTAAMSQDAGSSEETESGGQHEEQDDIEGRTTVTETISILPIEPLDPEEALRRQLRQEQLQADSDEKWHARKRRRRIRGWAGLPADAPGEPPRFPSETTLDESKAYLNLDNKLYARIREEFQAICRSENVVKKTTAGPDVWAAILQRLVRQNHHLTQVFHTQVELMQADSLWKPKNYKTLSLDMICQDVMKRMRVLETRMGMSEAKNTLGLNPSQTREARHAFLQILKTNRFGYKFEMGEQHWNEMKRCWIEGSEPLRTAVTSTDGVGDAERRKRLRAIEVLARDVMKRLRTENTRIAKETGTGDKATHQGPGPGPAPPSAPSLRKPSQNAPTTRNSDGTGSSALASEIYTHEHELQPDSIRQRALDANLQIDPSLLLAARGATLPSTTPDLLIQHPTTQNHHHYHHHHNINVSNTHAASYTRAHHSPPTTTTTNRSAQAQAQAQAQPSLNMNSNSNPPPSASASASASATASPLPIYFRLHPSSTTPFPQKTVWLSVLQTRTIEEVMNLAAREHPGRRVVALEGVVGTLGGEACVGIDDDAELGAYLGHVAARTGGGTGKACFVVTMGM